MHKVLLMAIGLSLASGAVAQAQPYGPPNAPPPVVRHDVERDRDDYRNDGWRRDQHHRRRVCHWRHNHRVCHWRHWR
jgi:hypothetical protein